MNVPFSLDDAVRIGAGRQGVVYRLPGDRCAKLYRSPAFAALEQDAYRRAAGSPHVPRVFDAGPNYLVLEYIRGPSLLERLTRNGSLEDSDVRLLLAAYRETKRLDFTRRDVALFHLLLPEDGAPWKMIDLVHAYRKTSAAPTVLLGGLRKLGLLQEFLERARELEPERIEAWAEAKRIDGRGDERDGGSEPRMVDA